MSNTTWLKEIKTRQLVFDLPVPVHMMSSICSEKSEVKDVFLIFWYSHKYNHFDFNCLHELIRHIKWQDYKTHHQLYKKMGWLLRMFVQLEAIYEELWLLHITDRMLANLSMNRSVKNSQTDRWKKWKLELTKEQVHTLKCPLKDYNCIVTWC